MATLGLVPNDQADVRLGALVDRAARPPRNPLLEPPHDYSQLGVVGPVVAEPRSAHFAGITPGEKRTQTLRLLNKSGKGVRMHIHAPATPFFSMSVAKRGLVMPGMAEEVTITFSGEDMRHYHDQLRVHTEFGHLHIPCLLYTSPSPRDQRGSRMPSSA